MSRRVSIIKHATIPARHETIRFPWRSKSEHKCFQMGSCMYFSAFTATQTSIIYTTFRIRLELRRIKNCKVFARWNVTSDRDLPRDIPIIGSDVDIQHRSNISNVVENKNVQMVVVFQHRKKSLRDDCCITWATHLHTASCYVEHTSVAEMDATVENTC